MRIVENSVVYSRYDLGSFSGYAQEAVKYYNGIVPKKSCHIILYINATVVIAYTSVGFVRYYFYTDDWEKNFVQLI